MKVRSVPAVIGLEPRWPSGAIATPDKSASAMRSDTLAIVVDEVFPLAPEAIWKTLTSGELISRWMMVPAGFAPLKGNHFTFQTTSAGAWDGVIHCEVLEVTPNESLAYAWKSGHESNVGYGSQLDTMVRWSVSRIEGGTQLCLVHSGFVTPKNDSAFRTMSEGWTKVVQNIGAIAADRAREERKDDKP